MFSGLLLKKMLDWGSVALTCCSMMRKCYVVYRECRCSKLILSDSVKVINSPSRFEGKEAPRKNSANPTFWERSSLRIWSTWYSIDSFDLIFNYFEIYQAGFFLAEKGSKLWTGEIVFLWAAGLPHTCPSSISFSSFCEAVNKPRIEPALTALGFSNCPQCKCHGLGQF